MYRLVFVRDNVRCFALLVLALGWLAFSRPTQAQNCPTHCDTNFNTAIGSDALGLDTNGEGNTAVGKSALQENQTGSANTAVGTFALLNNTADFNTAIGEAALNSNQAGTQNTATGVQALELNTSGSNNTANGYQSLQKNTSGLDNTANGAFALQSNTTANNNTATGVSALFHNTTGANNTANGGGALQSNTTASNNTADGTFALFSNTIGPKNAGIGVDALENNTSGGSNVAVGYLAGQNLTTGSNNIDIGANVLGNAGEANTIRIGKQGTQKSTFVAGIFGTAVTGSSVVVSSTGKLGVATSSARFKEAIKPMDKASEAILALKPVSFRYKAEVDPNRAPQFGLVAEEIEKAAPELVNQDEEGKPFTVRYEAVNAMLLNEFLKEHRKAQEQEAAIAQLTLTVAQQARDLQMTTTSQREQIRVLTTQLKEQAIQIQKMGTQLEMSNAALPITSNTH